MKRRQANNLSILIIISLRIKPTRASIIIIIKLLLLFFLFISNVCLLKLNNISSAPLKFKILTYITTHSLAPKFLVNKDFFYFFLQCEKIHLVVIIFDYMTYSSLIVFFIYIKRDAL